VEGYHVGAVIEALAVVRIGPEEGPRALPDTPPHSTLQLHKYILQVMDRVLEVLKHSVLGF